MLGYLSTDIICSEKRTVFRERSSRKTVSFEEQIMSKDKYLSTFLQPNWGNCVYYSSVLKIGEHPRTYPSFSWGIFAHVMHLEQSCASKNIWWTIIIVNTNTPLKSIILIIIDWIYLKQWFPQNLEPHNIHLCMVPSSNVSRDEVKGNIRTRGKTKLTRHIKCFVIYFNFPLSNHRARTNKQRQHNFFIRNRQSSWCERVLRIAMSNLVMHWSHAVVFGIRGTWPRINQSQCLFCWVKVYVYNNNCCCCSLFFN